MSTVCIAPTTIAHNNINTGGVSMKKTLILLTLLMLLLIPNTLAMAKTDTATEILSTVEAHDNVKSAKVLLVEDTCIIAIQPIGVVTRTEYDALVDSLSTTICDKYTAISNCHITRSVKAYRMIDKVSNMSDEDRAEAIEHLMDKLPHSPMTMPHLEPTN